VRAGAAATIEGDSTAAALLVALRGPVLLARARCAARLTPAVASRSFAIRSAGYNLAGKSLHGVRELGGSISRFVKLRLPGPHRLEAQDIALSRR